jgi:hypothetical protein
MVKLHIRVIVVEELFAINNNGLVDMLRCNKDHFRGMGPNCQGIFVAPHQRPGGGFQTA